METPNVCCALPMAIYFGSIWTAANKRLRSQTVKASGSPFHQNTQPELGAAQMKINEQPNIRTQKGCLNCETQNCFDSTTKFSTETTIKSNETISISQHVLLFPIQKTTNLPHVIAQSQHCKLLSESKLIRPYYF